MAARPHRSDAFPKFLKDALKHPILSQDEERKLIAIVEKGGLPEIDDSEESDEPDRMGRPKRRSKPVKARPGKKPTAKQRDAALKARERLIGSNLRLVLLTVNSVNRKNRSEGINRDDIFQEAVLGQMKGIERFDLSKKNRLSTYSGWWIRHRTMRVVQNHGRSVRIPVHQLDACYKYVRERERFIALNGREPTDKEIRKATRFSQEKLDSIRSISLDRVLSLDALVTSESEHMAARAPSHKDLLADHKHDPEVDVGNDQVKTMVRALVGRLRQPYRFVVEKRFLTDDPPTLTEVAEMLAEKFGKKKVSRERIRQIQEDGLKMLRERAPDDYEDGGL